MTGLREELSSVLNRYSRENMSDTPDFILADYLMVCLEAFEDATSKRDLHYRIDPWGRRTSLMAKHKPGKGKAYEKWTVVGPDLSRPLQSKKRRES